MIKLLLSMAALTVLVAPAKADPFASPWSKSQTSAARLIAAGGLAGGVRAGIEIALDGRGHTYWSAPGDAGVPPIVSFDGSVNLASADLLFPTPQRLEEQGAVIFGYERSVIFPLTVTPKDATASVTLKAKIDYAACERICVPAQASLQLTLPPATEAGPFVATIAGALAKLPKAATINGGGALAATGLAYIAGAAGAKPAIVLDIQAPAGAGDIFVAPAAPDGWFLLAGPPQPAGSGHFRIAVSVEQMPAHPASGAEATIVVVADGAAINIAVPLDLGKLTP